MLGELYCNFFYHHYGLAVVKPRFFNSYGPGGAEAISQRDPQFHLLGNEGLAAADHRHRRRDPRLYPMSTLWTALLRAKRVMESAVGQGVQPRLRRGDDHTKFGADDQRQPVAARHPLRAAA